MLHSKHLHIGETHRSASRLFICALAALVVGLSGCKDKGNPTGSATLSEVDRVVVCTDTFSIASEWWVVDSIGVPASSDSLLLGETDNQYGTIHADILTQFACPEGFEFPATAVVDSAQLNLYYQTWFGDGNSPL